MLELEYTNQMNRDIKLAKRCPALPISKTKPLHTQTYKCAFGKQDLLLYKEFVFFSPYIGAVVLRSRWKLTGKRTETFRFHQKYSVGPFLGCSISSPFQCLLNVEWRGWIENTWSVSGQIRF